MWTSDWKERFADLLACHRGHHNPMFFTPIASLKMEEVVAKAKEINVPLEDTVSCGQSTPCGICTKCTYRQKLGLPIC